MTADTAVIASKLIVENGTQLDELSFVDRPSVQIRKKYALICNFQFKSILFVHQREFVEMPFRYLNDGKGKPLLPDGMIQLWREDSF
jgi:ribosome biogenesis SPOUT family RNA methylase Rps3